MCGCSSGGGSSARSPVHTFRANAPAPDANCNYEPAQIQDWLDKVNCFKEKGLYVSFGITNRQLNIYIGTLMSAVNYPTNICYFQKQLDEIQSFITVVISTGQC